MQDSIEDPSQSELYDFEPGQSFQGKTSDEVAMLENAGKAELLLRQCGENIDPEIFEQYRTVIEELDDLMDMLQDPEMDRTLSINTIEDVDNDMTENEEEEREWPELVNEAYNVFSEHTEELGFVSKVQVEDALDEEQLYYRREDGKVVAAALIRHCKSKPQTTIQDIATLDEYKGNGYAKDMLDEAADDSTNPYMIAKCPADLPANHFYREDGWELQDVEEGKNRHLLVWRKEIVESESALDW